MKGFSSTLSGFALAAGIMAHPASLAAEPVEKTKQDTDAVLSVPSPLAEKLKSKLVELKSQLTSLNHQVQENAYHAMVLSAMGEHPLVKESLSELYVMFDTSAELLEAASKGGARDILAYEKYLEKSRQQLVVATKKIHFASGMLRIFREGADFFNPKNEIRPQLWESMTQSGIRFKSVNAKLYAFTSSGVPIREYTLPIKDGGKAMEAELRDYADVPLLTSVQLAVDTETVSTTNHVADMADVEAIRIPKNYAKMLQGFEARGFRFMVDYTDAKGFNMLVSHSDKVVLSVLSINSLWPEILVKNLNKIEKWMASEDYAIATIASPGHIESDILDRKIAFINAVAERQSQLWKTDEIMRLSSIISIGTEHGTPLIDILAAVPGIYESFHKQRQVIYPTLASNMYFVIPPVSEMLWKLWIPERDLHKIRNAYLQMVETVLQHISAKAPDYVLKNAQDLASYRTDLMVDQGQAYLNPYKSDNLNPFFINVLEDVLENYPIAIDKPIFDKIKEQYPNSIVFFGEIVKRTTNSASMVGANSHSTAKDVANATQYGKTLQILEKISDVWLDGVPPSDMTRTKFTIARNLSLQYGESQESLIEAFHTRGKQMVSDNLTMMRQLKASISGQTMLHGKSLYHLAHYGQGVDAFGTLGTQEALRHQVGSPKNYTLLDAETLKGKTRETQRMVLNQYLEGFVQSSKPATILMEGHANADSFSFLLDYDKKDALEIYYKGMRSINIEPKEIALLLKRRQEVRRRLGIVERDVIVFAACKGDYAIKLYNWMDRIGLSDDSNFIPPVVITAAEAGEDSIFYSSPDEKIPYQILKSVLDIGNTSYTTFGTFFQNQQSKDMFSNPALFYSVQMGGKWVPQQIR